MYFCFASFYGADKELFVNYVTRKEGLRPLYRGYVTHIKRGRGILENCDFCATYVIYELPLKCVQM